MVVVDEEEDELLELLFAVKQTNLDVLEVRSALLPLPSSPKFVLRS